MSKHRDTTEPTMVDTFLTVEFLFRMKNPWGPEVGAAHMRNLESVFGPEVVTDAMAIRREVRASERGTYPTQT